MHKQPFTTKSIIKAPSGDGLNVGSKSVCYPSKPLVKSPEKKEKSDEHYKSLKNKDEPLLLSDVDIIDEEDEIKDKAPKIEKNNSKIMEQFYDGKVKKKFFAPKRDQPSNNTEPINLKKKIILSKGENSKLKKQNLINKSKVKVNKTNEDSQNTSQKDVIVRRIKKKEKNSKTS